VYVFFCKKNFPTDKVSSINKDSLYNTQKENKIFALPLVTFTGALQPKINILLTMKFVCKLSRFKIFIYTATHSIGGFHHVEWISYNTGFLFTHSDEYKLNSGRNGKYEIRWDLWKEIPFGYKCGMKWSREIKTHKSAHEHGGLQGRKKSEQNQFRFPDTGFTNSSE